jgi:hypothetical protein
MNAVVIVLIGLNIGAALAAIAAAVTRHTDTRGKR